MYIASERLSENEIEEIFRISHRETKKLINICKKTYLTIIIK